MNAKQLRNAILQQAIEGRLVPQDPTDEPASVLLKRIHAEKQRLMKEGKLKKQKPLPPVTDEEKPFEIPESWEWVRLNIIFNFIDYRGTTPTKTTSGIPFITAKNIKEGFTDYNIKEYISLSDFEKRKCRGISKKGDILFTTEAPLGNVAIADLKEFSTGQRLIAFQQYSEKYLLVNSVFAFFLLSPFIKKQLKDKKTGTTVSGIKAEKLKNLLIPLPPFVEQQRIASKLKEVLPLVDDYGNKQDELIKQESIFPGRLRKSFLQEAIEGRLVPQNADDEPASTLLNRIRAEKTRLVKEGKLKKQKPLPPITDEEKPFEIPESWEWVRLGEIVEGILTGPFGSMLHKADYVPAGIPLVNPMNMIDGKVISSSKMMVDRETGARLNRYKLKNGDIVIARRGELGRCALITEAEAGWICGTGSFILRKSPLINADFIIILFKSAIVTSQLANMSVGTTMNNLNHSIVEKLSIPLPPLSEQKRIVAKLEELFPLCSELDNYNNC